MTERDANGNEIKEYYTEEQKKEWYLLLQR